jgi:hypothetical protein
VETKHEQPHLNDNPTFVPRNGSPTLEVHIRPVSNNDKDLRKGNQIWKELNKQETTKSTKHPNLLQEQQQQIIGENKQDQQQQGPLLMGGTKDDDTSPLLSITTTMTTYEYDVVACADFVLDQGCWIRNMPEEIRLANPTFVPS